ncbi:cyclic nucleotide-binding domain-containing protein [Brachyspira pulli]|uniref:cyclic nucleotide-binding domain-containing protein n=1 Tax=Brachyspira pulli TaxID=310721 RepID=UPI00300499BA
MNNYRTIRFPKDSLIYEEGNYPLDVFYIITKGKVISYSNHSKNYNREYNIGFIIGLVNLAINEPYFVTLKAVEDVEVIELNISDIKNLTNIDLIKKIYDYFNTTLETWLSRYYIMVVKNKVDLYYKESLFTMANIYLENGFHDAAYKLYDEYIKDFMNYAENIEEAKKEFSKLTPMPLPKKFSDNIFLYRKGACLYTELKPSNNLYIIMSGKVGIYNIINGELLLKDVYKKNYILNGYEPKLEYKPLSTSAIAIDTTYVKVISKEEFLEMLIKDKQLRAYNIKMMAVKVVTILLKMKSMEEENIVLKIFMVIYSILRIEILFEEPESILLSHTVKDIKKSINLTEEDIINNIRKINSIELIKNQNIKITNINNFFKEYHEYQKNNY